jgi:sterol carrier protein 2
LYIVFLSLLLKPALNDVIGAIALGFEKMKPGEFLRCQWETLITHPTSGSLGTNFPDRIPPTMLLNERTRAIEQETLGENHGPGAPRLFSNGAKEYFQKYGGTVEHLAKIGMTSSTILDVGV